MAVAITLSSVKKSTEVPSEILVIITYPTLRPVKGPYRFRIVQLLDSSTLLETLTQLI